MMIHPNLSGRRSILAFSSKAIDDMTLTALFEAARWAPSAFNEQPWRFIIARKGENGFDRLLDCLAVANQAWAKDAALLFLTLAKKTLTQNGKANLHALHDLGLAVGNITFQAREAGIDLHQMGGFDAMKARTSFDIPDDYEAVAVVAAGYPGATDDLPDALKARAEKPRVRKPGNELVFNGHFGHAHPIFMHPTQSN